MGIMAGSSEPVSRTPKSVSLKGNCLPSAGNCLPSARTVGRELTWQNDRGELEHAYSASNFRSICVRQLWTTSGWYKSSTFAGGVTLEGADKVAELALSVRSCAPNIPDEYHSLWNAIGEAWPSTGEKDLATAGSTGLTDTTSVG